MFLTGSQLRAARALAGLSRSQLAAATGVSVSALGCWERSSNGVILAKVSNLRHVVGVLEEMGIHFEPDGVFMRRADPVPTISTVVPSMAAARASRSGAMPSRIP